MSAMEELFATGRRLVEVSARVPHEALSFLGALHLRRVISYDPEGVEERAVEEVRELTSILERSDRVVWIDVQGLADVAGLERMGDTLGIHALAMADVFNTPQRPKAELYGDRLLIITQMARINEQGELEVEQVSLMVGPNWVLSLQERAGDVFDAVRSRIRLPKSRIRQLGPDFLAYALIDAVIDGYFPVLGAIVGVLDALEEEVMRGDEAATLARIHATRRTLLNLHRIQWSQRDALGTMLRDDEFPFTEPVRVYLRDAHDHAIHLVDAIETYREMTVGLMDLHLSSASNRMNEAMKTLTVVATIFIPLTFVAGVYGMNFDYMPELRWRWGYALAWGVMVAIAVGLVVWFRSGGWLEPGPRAPKK
jgi:magnesium transporter